MLQPQAAAARCPTAPSTLPHTIELLMHSELQAVPEWGRPLGPQPLFLEHGQLRSVRRGLEGGEAITLTSHPCHTLWPQRAHPLQQARLMGAWPWCPRPPGHTSWRQRLPPAQRHKEHAVGVDGRHGRVSGSKGEHALGAGDGGARLQPGNRSPGRRAEQRAAKNAELATHGWQSECVFLPSPSYDHTCEELHLRNPGG